MTTEVDTKLPDFERPPLDEVVLGIQFAPLPLRLVDVGAFHACISDNYPHAVDVPPLGPSFETFGLVPFQPLPFPLMVGAQWRCWFLSENDEYLIQLQPDRLLTNWRVRPGGDSYPRFSEIRRRLGEAAELFLKFIRNRSLPDPQINQCEVTYFNKVAMPDGVEFGDLGMLLKGAGVLGCQSRERKFPEGQMSFARILNDEGGSPFARLRVDVGAGFEIGRGKIWVMNLTVRGRPFPDSSFMPAKFFDLAHIEIVKTFAEISTKEMQEKWGRFQ